MPVIKTKKPSINPINSDKVMSAEVKPAVKNAMAERATENMAMAYTEAAEEDMAASVMTDFINTTNVTDFYNIADGNWINRTNETDNNAVCSALIQFIADRGNVDPKQFANILRDPAHKRLVYRCIVRYLKTEHKECTEADLEIALEALSMSEEDIITGLKSTMGASANGGGALYQVGGAFGAHVALALLLKLVNTPQLNATLLNAALKAPAAFKGALDWAAGKAGTISACLKSLLGIGSRTDAAVNESYYAILTNKIAEGYYRGAESVDAYKAAIKTWLEANPMDALGFVAVVMRYPRNVISITGATINALSSITLQTIETTFAIGSTIWTSDSGVLVCVLLYFYEKYGDQFNRIVANVSDIAKANFIKGINALGAIERVITAKIDTRHINGELNHLRTRLVQFEKDRKKSLVTDMTAQTLTLVAAVASKTSKLNFEAKQAESDTGKINALTDELNSALTALAAANITNAEALSSKSAAVGRHSAALTELATGGPGAMAPPGTIFGMATPGAIDIGGPGTLHVDPGQVPGGKSRSRKSHNKVSKSKRPKKSVHSRKAKGAKRSNKKH